MNLKEKATQSIELKKLEEIDKITLEEEFENISAQVEENIFENKINLNFNIEKTKRLIVEKINIWK